jgi:transposase InsO family protein
VTNGVVERFNQSIKYEHLYGLEIPDAITLAQESEAFRRLFNEIRPLESIGFATPLSADLAEPEVSNLPGPESVQDS